MLLRREEGRWWRSVLFLGVGVCRQKLTLQFCRLGSSGTTGSHSVQKTERWKPPEKFLSQTSPKMILTLKLDAVFARTPGLEGILLYFWLEII